MVGRQLSEPEADLAATLELLCGVAAPSGNEDRLTALIVDTLGGWGLEPRVDRLGQVSVALGEDAGPRVMVSAHLDELGLTVRTIDKGGWLGVERLGGVPERVLPGTRIVVHTRAGDVPGVVGLKAHHLTLQEEKYIAYPVTQLYVDIGGFSAEDVRGMGVRVGDPITYQPYWSVLGNGRLAGKALDNRAGVVSLLAYTRRLQRSVPSNRVYVAFSTQEEFNVRGSLALSAALRPDIVVNVDISPATDTPDLAGRGAVRLGGGPILSRLSFHGRGTLGGLVPHPALVRAVEEAAARANVPLQQSAIVGVVTDAAFLPMADAEGVAAVEVGIPLRYTHSPVETVQLSDVQACIDLLTALTPALGNIDLQRGEAQLKEGGIG
ncbi:MAG: M42 family metallopeptidase [Acidimicrobiales bacterium]